MTKKMYYLKERNNPQFDRPYYVCLGQLTKKEAKRKEETIYGYNIIRAYENEEDYLAAIQKAKEQGFNVHE